MAMTKVVQRIAGRLFPILSKATEEKKKEHLFCVRFLPPSPASSYYFYICLPASTSVAVKKKPAPSYFEGLVVHFLGKLLLLFLPDAGFLQLGLNAVNLHLVLHNCKKKPQKLSLREQSCRGKVGPFLVLQGQR